MASGQVHPLGADQAGTRPRGLPASLFKMRFTTPCETHGSFQKCRFSGQLLCQPLRDSHLVERHFLWFPASFPPWTGGDPGSRAGVFVSQACRDPVPLTGWLQRQNLIVS